jgi:hypothetical protein
MESTAPITPPDLLEAHTSQRRRRSEPVTVGRYEPNPKASDQ